MREDISIASGEPLDMTFTNIVNAEGIAGSDTHCCIFLEGLADVGNPLRELVKLFNTMRS